MLLLASGEAHRDLGSSVLEVEGERNDRKTLSVDPARPVFELVAVGEQLAASVVVVGISVAIGQQQKRQILN